MIEFLSLIGTFPKIYGDGLKYHQILDDLTSTSAPEEMAPSFLCCGLDGWGLKSILFFSGYVVPLLLLLAC